MANRYNRRPRHQPPSPHLAAVLTAVVAVVAVGVASAERHVSVGAGHVCAIQAGGVAACYGDNRYGKANASTVGVGVRYHAVTVGTDFSCGLTLTGSNLVCWGALPGTPPPPLTTFFIDAHAGTRHVCGLMPNGTVVCYGDGTTGATAVPPGVAFQGVTAGVDYTCGVTRAHSVQCWGNASNPVLLGLPAITDAEHVAAGADHACYIRTNGTVRCWGANSALQALPPASMSITGPVWWLAAGTRFTCGMAGTSAPAAITCWGAIPSTWTTAFEVACTSWGCVASEASGTGMNQTVSIGVLQATNATVPLAVAAQFAAQGSIGAVQILAGGGGSTFVNGVGTIAKFLSPRGIAVTNDGTTVFVADTGNHCIRRINVSTRNVTTLAGVCGASGSCGSSSGGYADGAATSALFNNPNGVEVDSVSGTVYVADTSNYRIRMVSASNVVSTLAGNGVSSTVNAVGTAASFSNPVDVALDSATGVLYIADSSNIRAVNLSSRSVTLLFGTSASPTYVAAGPGGRIVYSAYYTVSQATAVQTGYNLSAIAGKLGISGYADGTGTNALFNSIYGLAAAADGTMFAAEWNNNRVRMITPAGVVTTVAGGNTGGTSDGVGGAARFGSPTGIARDDAGLLYVCEINGHVVRQITPRPTIVSFFAAPLPPSVAASSDQLTSWRSLAASLPAGMAAPFMIDAQNVSVVGPLTPTTTAALNSVISSLYFGVVELAARDPTGVGANVTFSSSARRGLRTLTLATAFLPSNALNLSLLTTLNLAAPPLSTLTLAPRSFAGLLSMTCLNCGGANSSASLAGQRLQASVTSLVATGLFACPAAATTVDLSGTMLEGFDVPALNGFATLRTLYLARNNFTAPPRFLPANLAVLDLSGNNMTDINERDFDGSPALVNLSLARNQLQYVNDATWTNAKHRALTAVDLTGNPLLATSGSGTGCRPATYISTRWLAAGAQLTVCSACPAGSICAGGTALPSPCAPGRVCTLGTGSDGGSICPAGSYCPGGSTAPVMCPGGVYCPAGSAAANLTCPRGAFCPPGSPAPPPMLGLTPAAAHGSLAAATMVLLPPLASVSATAAVNITIVGTLLCVGSVPRIVNVTVAGVPCATLVCSSCDWQAVCTGWNASSVVAALPAGATTAFLNASGVWTEVTPPAAVYCDDCIAAATRPVLRAVVPSIVAAAGVPIVVTGTGLLDAAASPPTVLVGGTPCTPVIVLLAEAVQCIVPTVTNPPPSFPVVPVVVINAAGAASTEVITMSYPDAFTVAWAPASAAARFVALPGVRLTQPPALSLLSRDNATCSLTLNATDCGAAGTGAALARPTGMSITVAEADLMVGASTSGNATATLLPLQSAVASGASGCVGTLAAACLDAAGNAAASSAAASPVVGKRHCSFNRTSGSGGRCLT